VARSGQGAAPLRSRAVPCGRQGCHDEIEQWSFRGGWIFVSVGSADDEADADIGHGWMSRLVDSGALAVANFERVRKAEIR
jgi:hypothetical protein